MKEKKIKFYERICTHCHKVFNTKTRQKQYCSVICREERRVLRRKGLIEDIRTCPTCKNLFTPSQSNHKYCSKECYGKVWRERNKKTTLQNRIYRVKAVYGINYEQILQKLEGQNNKCFICKEKITPETLHIDHNHKNNKVRGLLCGCCNKGLGQFKDNTQYLSNAIIYLEATNEI